MNGKELASMGEAVRRYAEERGLDPQKISGNMHKGPDGWVVTGHMDIDRLPGYAIDRCCCGIEGCDGGLAERLEAWGIDPAEVATYQGTIGLGES